MIHYNTSLVKHYEVIWGANYSVKKWTSGPMPVLTDNFFILEFSPANGRNFWIYATVGMSNPNSRKSLELHIFSPNSDLTIVELLTVTAHYHQTGQNLNLNHTINFGRPWKPHSICNHGFISLPYLYGPKLEILNIDVECQTNCYWLIPVTSAEVEYKKRYGTEALENLFERKSFNYLDPLRKGVA